MRAIVVCLPFALIFKEDRMAYHAFPHQSSESQASATNTDVPAHESEHVSRPQDPNSTAPQAPAQQAWNFANSMLRSYGPAAVAASSSLFRPLRGVNTNSLHADVPLDDVAQRKKYDDLGVAGPFRSMPREKQRLYSQEVITSSRQDRRIQSASAALVGDTGGVSSGSAYSTYTRAQLRQRRLELERELAALENTSIAGSEASDIASAGGLTPARGKASTPSTIRERHISAPSLPLPGERRSPAVTPPGLEASTTFETIARDEVVDQDTLPNDWGRDADRRGWRGAPDPTQLGYGTSPPARSTERPSNQKRTSWSFWSGSASHAPSDQLAASSGSSKKDA